MAFRPLLDPSPTCSSFSSGQISPMCYFTFSYVLRYLFKDSNCAPTAVARREKQSWQKRVNYLTGCGIRYRINSSTYIKATPRWNISESPRTPGSRHSFPALDVSGRAPTSQAHVAFFTQEDSRRKYLADKNAHQLLVLRLSKFPLTSKSSPHYW